MVDLDKSKIQAVAQYIDEISKQFSTGKATEHSYRPALAKLLGDLLPKFTITNEPSRIQCGAPDYIITKGKGATSIPVAFVEAKDIGDNDLDGNRQHKEQFNRYKNSLDHILFTDYLDFHAYENGTSTQNIRIAEIRGDKIALIKANIPMFLGMIAHLAESKPQKITNSSQLAQMMAAKARLLAEVVEKTLEADREKSGELAGQWKSFQSVLIHDLTERQFADIYAQTICYGMFAARLHDDTPDTFSRAEAAELIPKTNPFLRKIFQSVATFDVDSSIVWIIDDLAETFRVTDTSEVMKNFGKATGQADPMIHFYEDFLRYYDPKQKKACGVYYTPEPVVHFIVNAVDEILKTQFELENGLADATKHLYHKVQILDPATGTGTFLAEVVRKIYSGMENQKGAWQNYVEEHLLPRLNGFEFMMAPYAVAHLKLDMVLDQTGYKARQDKRLRIFLTNSLEEYNPNTGTFFAQWLAQEAKEADLVKRDTPVMVMMGNPPYNGKSSNNGKWIMGLLKDYKKEPGGKQKLKERNSKWINDDYVKFIRLGQYYVEKNGEGVLAFINPHGFLDNPTFRGMRWNLLQAFDEIYTIDLHGNSKKKEVAPDGGKDENVFDIMQGVSINIFVKKKNVAAVPKKTPQGLANVYHYEIYGKRVDKYDFLHNASFKNVSWEKLSPRAPQYFFVPKSEVGKEAYEKGFGIDELLKINSMGVTTGKDKVFVNTSLHDLQSVIISEYGCCDEKLVRNVLYRPFDKQYLYYDVSKLARARESLAKNFDKDNYGLCLIRINSRDEGLTVFITDKITDKTLLSSKDNANVFPLYLYPSDGEEKTDETRKPNLDEKIWRKIDKCTKLKTTPEQVFDYIYGVLHTPSYREKYKEFLKIDFPRIPYPENKEEFERVVSIGKKLRKLHLMEEVPPQATSFAIEGDNVVSEIRFEKEKVYINKTQYFGNVPDLTWNFYIGGYQPAQKWLKDRKNRPLTYDDISHYRKIIAILLETHKLMLELDKK